MKSQIISINNHKGFLLPEIMIAFSIMTLFIVSFLVLSFAMDRLRVQAVQHLDRLEFVIPNIASSTLHTKKLYGNDTQEIFLDPITLLVSDYANGWGRDTCDPRFSFNISSGSSQEINLYAQGVSLGTGNVSTDIEVRNGVAYLAADSTTASSPDLYVIDIHDPASPFIMSSLNTGPGLTQLEVAGHYIYAANLGTTHQLHIIDIADRASPVVVAKLKLPLPNASSTAPFASSLFYHEGFIYLGTEKWEGKEFSVIDVSIPSSPLYLGGFEMNTLLNDIYVRDGIAYVAASDIGQMRFLNISNPMNIIEIATFSPSGWATQQGKTLSYFENRLFLGRTTGGFNVVNNHEVFIFPTSTLQYYPENSRDIPGGIYGLLYRSPYIYLATRSPGHEFQIWKEDLSELISEKSLGFLPRMMACDELAMYFATGDSRGIAVLKNK